MKWVICITCVFVSLLNGICADKPSLQFDLAKHLTDMKRLRPLWSGGSKHLLTIVCDIGDVDNRLVSINTAKNKVFVFRMPIQSPEYPQTGMCCLDRNNENVYFVAASERDTVIRTQSLGNGRISDKIVDGMPSPRDRRDWNWYLHQSLKTRAIIGVGPLAIEVSELSAKDTPTSTTNINVGGKITSYGIAIDAKLIAIGVQRLEGDRNVYSLLCYDLRNPKKCIFETRCDDCISTVRYAANGQKLIVGSLDGSLHIWSARDGKLLKGFRRPHGISSTDINVNESLLVFSTFEKEENLIIVDLKTLNQVGMIKADSKGVQFAGFVGEDVISIGGERVAKIWPIEEFLQKPRGPKE